MRPYRFAPRHNSASQSDVDEMVKVTNFDSLDALIEATVPTSIKLGSPMDLGPKYNEGLTESEFLDMFKYVAYPPASINWDETEELED